MPPTLPGAKPMYYNFANTIVSVQNVPLSHFGSDGGIKFEYVTPDRRTSEVSADGKVHVVRENDPRMLVTLTFKRVCPAAMTLRLLSNLCDAQEDNGLGLATFAFSFQESVVPGRNGNADTCTSPVAYFKSVPAPEFMKGEGELEFVIELPNGRSEFIPGSALALQSIVVAPTTPT